MHAHTHCDSLRPCLASIPQNQHTDKFPPRELSAKIGSRVVPHLCAQQCEPAMPSSGMAALLPWAACHRASQAECGFPVSGKSPSHLLHRRRPKRSAAGGDAARAAVKPLRQHLPPAVVTKIAGTRGQGAALASRQQPEVLVVGGGAAGLTAAYFAASQGARVGLFNLASHHPHSCSMFRVHVPG